MAKAEQKDKQNKQVGRRTALISFEIAMVTLMALAILGGGFAWRLLSSPLNVNFIKPYLEEAISQPDDGFYLRTQSAVLYLPDLRSPLLLGLGNVSLVNKQEEEILDVEELAVSVSLRKLIFGKLALRQIILRHPILKVTRTEEEGVSVNFSSQKKSTDDHAEEQEAITSRVIEFLSHPGEDKVNSSLSSLESVDIENARVLVEDHVLGVSWYLPRFDGSLKSSKKGLVATAGFALPDVKGGESWVRSTLSIKPDNREIAAVAEVKNFDVKILAGKIPGLEDMHDQDLVLTGKLEALLSSDLTPQTVRLAMGSEDGSFIIPGLYTEAVPYRDFAFEASYSKDNGKLVVQGARITAGGIPINMKADLTQAEERISGPVEVLIEDLPQEKIAGVWPDTLQEDNSRTWIVENITGGTYTRAAATIGLEVFKDETDAWTVDAEDIHAEFDFEGMSVNYRPPLTPVTNAKGKGSFDYKAEKLSVSVEEAALKDMVIHKGEVELVNIIEAGKGVADIAINLSGPVRSALQYTLDEPIALGDKIDFDLTQVKGQADLDVHLNFPTLADLKTEQVKIDITGTATDVYIPDVVEGLALSKGPLKLKVDNEAARVSGKGELEGRAVDLEWMEYLSSKGKSYAGRIKASLIADPNLRQHFGIILDDIMEGSAPVNVTYTSYADDTADADIIVNLAPVRMFAKPFDYEKVIGLEGSATLKAMFVKGALTQVKDLVVQAPGLSVENSVLGFRSAGKETELASGTVSRFTVGETVAGLEFDIAPDSGQIKVSLSGPFLDLRPFLNDDPDEKQQYDDPPFVASVAVDAMRTADGESVQYAKMFVDIDKEGRFNQLELDAIAGSGDVYLRFKPDAAGKRTFRLEADDAGATLKAFDVYDKIVGGQMVAYAEPIENVYDRNLVGSAQITDFKVVKAPALAKLLGLMSLGGIMEVLNGEGLNFKRLESNFDWLYRPRGGLLVLKDGRTSGSSIGLTFDGTFDNGADTLNVSGTIIPMSGINEVISSIPLFGDILTGGSGGVFAATYSVKGDAKKPEIFVNPLSVLAPGIIRRILFENN